MKIYLGFVAVSVFLLSCTNTDRDNPYDMWGSNYMGNAFAEGSSSSVETDDDPSSSSVAPSSSSVEPSSSSVEPSSSSTAPSSSSAVPSSSSVPPSSSSVAPSSSSVVLSSSSAPPSSSSVAPSSSSNAVSSSSSYGGLCADFDGAKRLHYGKDKDQFCDERDGKKYVYVVIGTQTWMAENLNYNPGGSCYDNRENNCTIYGRLYNWDIALTVCPAGWHLPSQAEWNVLDNDTKKLKATSGCYPGNSTDDYGFSALPGGYGYSDGGFMNGGADAFWWSASEVNGDNAYSRTMYCINDIARWGTNHKSFLFSVRCLQD